MSSDKVKVEYIRNRRTHTTTVKFGPPLNVVHSTSQDDLDAMLDRLEDAVGAVIG